MMTRRRTASALVGAAVIVGAVMVASSPPASLVAGTALFVVAGVAIVLVPAGPHLTVVLTAVVGAGVAPIVFPSETADVGASIAQTIVLIAGVALFVVLRRRQAAAERAGREQFLSTMSHRLRTPLTAVTGFTDLLRSTTSGEANGMLTQLADNIADLSASIDDILIAARSDSGLAGTRSDPVDVHAEVLREVGRWGTRDVARHQIVATGPLPRAHADAVAVRRVLHRLLSNAAHHGGPHVRITIEPGRAGSVDVAVADDGPGLPPAVVDHVFGTPVPAPSLSLAEPTGLGLVVARHLSRQMGGDLGHTRRDGWTEVRLSLPAVDLTPAATPTASRLPSTSEM